MRTTANHAVVLRMISDGAYFEFLFRVFHKTDFIVPPDTLSELAGLAPGHCGDWLPEDHRACSLPSSL